MLRNLIAGNLEPYEPARFRDIFIFYLTHKSYQ